MASVRCETFSAVGNVQNTIYIGLNYSNTPNELLKYCKDSLTYKVESDGRCVSGSNKKTVIFWERHDVLTQWKYHDTGSCSNLTDVFMLFNVYHHTQSCTNSTRRAQSLCNRCELATYSQKRAADLLQSSVSQFSVATKLQEI